MKRLLFTGAIAVLLVPLHAQPIPDAATLLEWQNADAPVALVEEIGDPALRTPGKLSVRILATSDCILPEGTILLLDAEGIPQADASLPRQWILNLANLKQLRSLHPRQEVLQASAPSSAFAEPVGMSTFSWSERSSWSDIVRHHTEKGISDEELRRLPVICRENFTPHSRRFEQSGKWFEEYTMVCDMALPESWCKGYQPGERIVLHWPVIEVSGSTPSPEEQKALAGKALRMGDFLLTARFERQGNTVHLYRDDCRIIPGHKGNTDRISALLAQENAPGVQLQFSEYSPYMPDDAAARSVPPLERNCHFVYKGLQTRDTLLRCKYISRQIIDFPDARLSHLYKCEYNVVEILECLKGEWKPGKRISFWRKVEGCKLNPGTYAAEGEFFLGFNQRDAEWLPTEDLTYIGRDDFQFMRLRAGHYSEAVQKVMLEYPGLFGKEKQAERKASIDTEQARQVALQVLREQQYDVHGAYNVQGLGSYLYVYPAKGCGAHVLLHPDGKVARIFTPDAE